MYVAAQASVTQSRPSREMLALDPHVSAGLTPSPVEALLDPARYTGLCRQFGAGTDIPSEALVSQWGEHAQPP